jgi:copper chaperone CopZ
MGTTTVLVSGMTCEHCVKAVTRELAALDGVQGVAIDLVTDGTSAVTITSRTTLDAEVVRQAVDEAGLAVVES